MFAPLTRRASAQLDRIPFGRKHQPRLDRFAPSSPSALKSPLPCDIRVQTRFDQLRHKPEGACLHRGKACDPWPGVQCHLNKEHLPCDQGRAMLERVRVMLEQVHVRINPDSDQVQRVSDQEQRGAGEREKQCVSAGKSIRTECFQIEATMSG